MRSFFVITGSSARAGGWRECLLLAREMTQRNGSVVQIATARAGEKKARIVAEVTPSSERLIKNGRIIKIRRLRHGEKTPEPL